MKCYNIIYNYDCQKEKITGLSLENVELEHLTIMSQLALSNLVLVQSCIKDHTIPPVGLYLYYPEFTVALRYEPINTDCENSPTNV